MKRTLREIIYKNGIEYFGVCSFGDISPYLIKCRCRVRLPSKPLSVITMLFPYYIPVLQRNISRYAIVKDYHIVVMNILQKISSELLNTFADFAFVPFTDSSPIPEVRAAVLSGLGSVGDNGLLINKKYGSWVFIGEIVTDMDIPVTRCQSGCIHCGACKKCCPGSALTENGFVKNKCLSYVTQKKGILTPSEVQLISNHGFAWGCDTCQDVCPLASSPIQTPIYEFITDIHPVIYLGDYDTLSNRAFHWRPKEVIERNILIISSKNQCSNNLLS